MKINNVVFDIEMSNLAFRFGVIWAALTKNYLKFSSRESTFNDNFVDEFRILLKLNKK